MNNKFLSLAKVLYSRLPSFAKRIIDSFRFRSQLQKALKVFLSDSEREDGKVVNSIKRDIINCKKLYGTTPPEFFLFGFRNTLSYDKRSEFLSDSFRNKVLLRLMGQDLFTNELRNKYHFYKLTSKYFKREVLFFDRGTDFESFKHFALKCKDLFIKRNTSSKGRGIISKHVESEDDTKGLYNYLRREGDEWVIEETIRQVKEMAHWNESSVNTVRLPAILNNDQFSVMGCFFRTGRKGAIADNAGAGGIFACIDCTTGIINTDGIDENGVYYTSHPNSGLAYKGWQIPKWGELLKLAEEIHRSIPWHKYIGWDFALTDNGWVLVEGNWGQFVSQYNDHIGLKNLFLSKLGVLDSSFVK